MSRRRIFLFLGMVSLIGGIGCFILLSQKTEIRLPAIFSDGLVLEANATPKIWGWTLGAEKVSIVGNWNGREISATPDEKTGFWEAQLETPTPGGPFEISVSAGRETRTISDVLIGEVWLAAGQSNMKMALDSVDDAAAEIENANFPEIRFFEVKRKSSSKKLADVEGSWVTCSSATAGNFSAVAYFFAETLHRKKTVPIGMIVSAWGGTKIESWISREAQNVEPAFAKWLAENDELARRPWDEAEAKREFAAAKNDYEKNPLKPNGRKKPRPQLVGPPSENEHRAGNLFNAMISPLTTFSIRGVLWYQGESNAFPHQPDDSPSSDPEHYASQLPILIRDWRGCWETNFPFLMVQLPRFGEPDSGNDLCWATIREAQQKTAAAISGVELICTTDLPIASRGDIHPKTKRPIGERLAAMALNEPGFPILKGVRLLPNEKNAQIEFETFGRGLAEKNIATGFEIGDGEGNFQAAEGTIQGDSVLLNWPEEMKSPTEVRYNWADHPVGNLESLDGLPVLPFRQLIH